jgi:hypothetical protein
MVTPPTGVAAGKLGKNGVSLRRQFQPEASASFHILDCPP